MIIRHYPKTMILQKNGFYEVLCHFYEKVDFCLIIEKMMKIDTKHELEENVTLNLFSWHHTDIYCRA